MISNKTILLGVTGSIAAYKIADLASRLAKEGCNVHVLMTKNAAEFIPLLLNPLPATNVLLIRLTGIFNLILPMFPLPRKRNCA